MPELPEVETVRRQLAKVVCGNKITNIIVKLPRLVGGDSNALKKLIGAKFTRIDRIGKLLIFYTSVTDTYLLVHLKMTGQLIFVSGTKFSGGGHTLSEGDLMLPNKHSHIIIEMTNGVLYFNDQRTFGYMKLVNGKELKEIKLNYGIEPLTPTFTWKNFQNIFMGRKTTIKALLLNQKLVSGLGNIYVDEICFLSGVMPDRKVEEITLIEMKKLFKNTEKVMKTAIENKGTTFYSFTNADGEKGNHKDSLYVFGREGEKCFKCKQEIKKIRTAGRGTHFCSKCQV